jgi:hypothetical protein
MPDNLAVPIAVVAGVLNVVGFVPYLRDILRHKTKPERAMWWIYAVLFGVLFAAQVDAGAGWLVFVTGAWTLDVVIYPVYAVLGTGLLVWVIMHRRTKVKQDLPDF